MWLLKLYFYWSNNSQNKLIILCVKRQESYDLVFCPEKKHLKIFIINLLIVPKFSVSLLLQFSDMSCQIVSM